MKLSTGVFSKDVPRKTEEIMSGDNTAGGPYGDDLPTFGDPYGTGQYGGFTHFKNRKEPSPLQH